MTTSSGPVHPCPVCDSPEQTCTGSHVFTTVLPDAPTPVPLQGDGPLRRYVVDGRGVMLTDDDARRLGLLEED